MPVKRIKYDETPIKLKLHALGQEGKKRNAGGSRPSDNMRGEAVSAEQIESTRNHNKKPHPLTNIGRSWISNLTHLPLKQLQ